ncbi:MAG: shikimate kinase [Erysipelotrichaceae bacterium]|nr:shikimate kinase [Erysipelotrichaceae bacterium]
MKKYGLLGEHLGHSFSPEIHHLLGNREYDIKEVSRENLEAFMREKDFLGLNVTIPYKQAVIPYLYEMDEASKKIGAINTIVNKDGKLYGYNTDFYGLLDLIEKADISIKDNNVFILGSGGTSKTAYAACEYLGAKDIVKVSRCRHEDYIDYEELYKRKDEVDIIINTTPAGMYPNNDESPIDIDGFMNLKGVIDVIYNPITTKLVYESKKKNIKAVNGLYMLVRQAVVADEKFFDKKSDEKINEEVYKTILNNKMNIVLTGMPSCGKSTVGYKVAEMLNKEFVDVDTLIKERYGDISHIFETEGENRFRDYEEEIIREVSLKNNAVIATGGGSILRDNNIFHLKQNGKIFFIDRDPEYLTPTSDRPTASDYEAIRKRYRERYERYCDTCDEHIDGNGSVDEVAQRIREAI